MPELIFSNDVSWNDDVVPSRLMKSQIPFTRRKHLLAFRNWNKTIVAILQKGREEGENYAKCGVIFIIIIIIWLHVSDLILQNLYLLNLMLGLPNGVKNT